MPERPERTVVVVSTGTDVGKTWVTAALARGLVAAGVRVAAGLAGRPNTCGKNT